MFRTMSLLGGLLCLVASVGVAVGGWLRPTPVAPAVEELAITPAVHDFGSVGQAEILAAAFTVTNHYRQPVHILELAKSCSCVEMTAATNDLAPGDSTTVRVGWRTHGKRGQTTDSLAIRYQVDNMLSVKTFRMVADILPDVTYSPEVVRFGGHNPTQQKVTIQAREGILDVRVIYAHCTSAAIKVLSETDGQSVTLT